jgi:protein-L-isoaspartate(D-aspartate) O-methyltransferase
MTPQADVEHARFNMVEQQIRPWEVLDQQVLDLLFRVHREDYVPPAYRMLAFADMEIPLGHGENMLTPKIEARTLQELHIKPSDRVLEVGTGSGYLTALLSHRAAHVVSVEINPALAAFGRANVERHGADNVTLEIGDAARGWPAHAPYDAIVLTGSTPLLPPSFVEQLARGGRLFAVVGEAPAMTARIIVSSGTGWRSTTLFETVISPLVNAERPSRFRF